MKNITNLSSMYKGLEDIFNPPIAYQGDYVFPISLLVSNSKVKDGVNMVEKYFEKYYKIIKNSFDKMKLINNPPLFLLSNINENQYGRSLRISISLLVMEFCREISGDTFVPSEDFEELQQQVKEYSRKYRKDLMAIKNGEMTPEREIMLKNLQESFQKNEEARLSHYGLSYSPMSFEIFLEKKKEYMINFSFGIKSLIPAINKNLNLDELAECLNLEKFYLAFMKQLVEISRVTIASNNQVHNSFAQVATYVSMVKDVRSKGHYDVSTTFTYPNGQTIKYTVDDLIKEYNEIRLENPDFEIIQVEGEIEEDLRDANKAIEYSRQLEDIMASKELQASWNFIRNGNREETPSISTYNAQLKRKLSTESTRKKYQKSREELIENTNNRIDFLDSTRYLYKMNGKNNFDGYVGYIYENGSVIFEKFYRSLDSHEPASANATYVMSFNNFVEMSKRTKPEIMNFIKNGVQDLRRIYHTSTWCDRIIQVINGRTYNQEAMERIERLINEGQLLKKS